MIKQCVAKFIEQQELFKPSDKILVALSGGADSVALLHILLSLGYACEAAHCNFHLRGNESNRDEQFVRELCNKNHVHLHVIEFDTYAYARSKGLSIEMAARELRYSWFYQIKKEVEASYIAVAHHKDDSVETMLLNLIRGTGINGLLGIKLRNEKVVRPLLCLNRQDIINYLHSIKQDFVTDSTNLQDEYTRNKIRLNIIPLMEEINPSIKDGLMETAMHLNEVALLYNIGIENGKKSIMSSKGISIDALLKEPSPKALLFEILHPLGFNSAQIKDMIQSLNGQSGKQFLSKQWRVIKDRDYLLIEKTTTNEEKQPNFTLIKEEIDYTSEFNIPRDKHTACFDADKLAGEISIRLWKQGDTFVPFGMKGTKNVSDYLTDRKFSINQKENQWVLCCNDKIAWIIGERTDDRFRIDQSTQKMVLFKMR